MLQSQIIKAALALARSRMNAGKSSLESEHDRELTAAIELAILQPVPL